MSRTFTRGDEQNAEGSVWRSQTGEKIIRSRGVARHPSENAIEAVMCTPTTIMSHSFISTSTRSTEGIRVYFLFGKATRN